MARVCQVTGKRPMSGNNISHAHNKTRRRFLPNLHTHRFWVPSQNCYIKLRVSANGMRIIDKKGIEPVLAEMHQQGIKIKGYSPQKKGQSRKVISKEEITKSE